MRKKRRILKKILLGLLLFCFGISLCFTTFFFATTYSCNLDTQKIDQATAANINFFDNQDNIVKLNSTGGRNSFASFDQLQAHTIDAFVSVEDKRFFDHHGIDYIRILGAIKNNILHPNKQQGGSTISQQVIKNTQLSSEKTIKRKLKEMKLAKQLEKTYSKQEILEVYLNSIYFGNGCYGIENASKYYFNKSASDLTIAESAMLASTINAPSIYDPVAHFDKATTRKELVLNLMKKNNKISQQEYEQSVSQEIEIAKAKQNYQNQYYKGVINEACKILNVTESQLKNMDVEIKTYYDAAIQSYLETLITSGKYTSFSSSAKLGTIILDNASQSVVAFAGNSGLNLLKTYRQPGSTIKPILVYAPAFESGKYSPPSIVCDQPIDINGYKPENANKTYLGNIDVKSCLKKSLNVPAVTILNDIGINYAKSYASGMGINFENGDKNLAIALGGFTKGTTIKQLCDAYMCFANGGTYAQSSFISEIYKAGETIYTRKIWTRQPVKDSVAFLINDCLCECAKSGTAKRMNSLNLPLCSKTGTVGSANGNSDAYNICYTTEHTIGCWIGANDTASPLPSNINGSTYPTLFNIQVLQNIYSDHTPANFNIPNSVQKISLNGDALNLGLLEQDDNGEISAYFDSRYIPPKTTRNNLDVNLQIVAIDKPKLMFEAKRDIVYYVQRKNGNQEDCLKKIQYASGKVEFIDEFVQPNTIYEYWIIAKKDNQQKNSNSIKILSK